MQATRCGVYQPVLLVQQGCWEQKQGVAERHTRQVTARLRPPETLRPHLVRHVQPIAMPCIAEYLQT